MSLAPGDRLGPYEIVAPLGAGGMGEVYRGRDTRLDRDVAIKVLPPAFAADVERLARFDREAKALAALNHPHIAQIYGFEEANGTRALAMELAPGATLKGPLPMALALDYARQIAEALEAAHEKGITHRDLKPANIMVSPEGVVKVLDFGLATIPAREAGDLSSSPTMTMAATQAGMIMGTAAYMSPEQAAGRPVDRRADIWSFGVVLYEMLAGRQMFDGETVSHTLADVLRAPIDLDALPKETPGAIRDLLRRCLVRDPRKRLRDIGDARLVIEEVLSGAVQEGPATALPAARRKSSILWPVLSGLLAAGLAALASVHFREQPPPPPEPVRFQIPLPGPERSHGTFAAVLSVSPDGKRLAFSARNADGRGTLWVRSLDSTESRPLAQVDGPTALFWSPDGRYLATAFARNLYRIDASSGIVQTICPLPGNFAGGAWGPDGMIIFTVMSVGQTGYPMMRVSPSGGAPVPVEALADQRHVGIPSFLPDGRHFLYARSDRTVNEIHVGSLDARPERQPSRALLSLPAPSAATFVPSANPRQGYILFSRDGVLLAQPFDTQRLALAGEPTFIANGVASFRSFSASSTGVLAYQPGNSADSQLLWFDRQSRQLGQLGPAGAYGNITLSPDGKLLVVDYRGSKIGDRLSVSDTVRGVFTRLNAGDKEDYSGVPSPDGRVAFTWAKDGPGDVYVRAANGGSEPELLVKNGNAKHPNHWSVDGRYVVYDEHTPDRKQDLYIVPMAGDRKPIPFLETPADETDAAFSPDSRWVAYSSDESGTREVYVQGFVPDRVPAAGIGKWRISAAGGAKPKWRRDGKELYYIATGGKMMAVPVKSTASSFEPGIGVPLFDVETQGYAPYDVDAQGRFLINTTVGAGVSQPITVVLNWIAGLKR